MMVPTTRCARRIHPPPPTRERASASRSERFRRRTAAGEGRSTPRPAGDSPRSSLSQRRILPPYSVQQSRARAPRSAQRRRRRRRSAAASTAQGRQSSQGIAKQRRCGSKQQRKSDSIPEVLVHRHRRRAQRRERSRITLVQEQKPNDHADHAWRRHQVATHYERMVRCEVEAHSHEKRFLHWWN